MQVINFTGEPSSGKSTAANALYAHMKQQGYNVELITEHSKLLAYQGNHIQNQDQMFVFAQQQHLMFILANQMNPNTAPLDYIITDSPLYLSIVYGEMHLENQKLKNAPIQLPDSFFQMVSETYQSYDNVNILMKRNHDFASKQGRFHDEEVSQQIRNRIQNYLTDMNEPHIVFETRNMNDGGFNLGKTLFDMCLENNYILDLKVLQEQKYETNQVIKQSINAIVDYVKAYDEETGVELESRLQNVMLPQNCIKQENTQRSFAQFAQAINKHLDEIGNYNNQLSIPMLSMEFKQNADDNSHSQLILNIKHYHEAEPKQIVLVDCSASNLNNKEQNSLVININEEGLLQLQSTYAYGDAIMDIAQSRKY